MPRVRATNLPVLLPLLLALMLSAAPPPAAAQEGSTDGDASGSVEWSAKRLMGSLEFPVDIAFGPDGTLYYAELRTGHVRAVPQGADEPLPDPVVSVDASEGGNGGFLGLVLDPDFQSTGAFYVYYSMDKSDAESGKVNRVSRVTPEGEQVLVDDIPWAHLHDGGRLVFTDRDTLVVTTGDNEDRDPAQDPDDLRGKTLRITKEGKPAPGNPDPASIVYTIGHRNPFGIAYDAQNDRLFVTENGPDRGDEVNLLVPGGNYGWPKRLGVSNDSDYEDPIWAFDKPIGPTGATILHGDLYFADFNFGQVHRLALDDAGEWRHEVVWEGDYDGMRALDVEAGPDGRLYVGTYDAIYVLTPPDGARPPPPAFEEGGAPDELQEGGAPDEGADGNATAPGGEGGTDGDPGVPGGDAGVPADGGANVQDGVPEEAVGSAPTPAAGLLLVLGVVGAVALGRAARGR